MISEPPAASEATATEGLVRSDPDLLGGGGTTHGPTAYWVVLAVLLVSTPFPHLFEWNTDRMPNALFDISCALLAIIIGVLALVRFYSKKRGTYLFMGTGFLGTALLDLNHALAEVIFAARTPLEIVELSSWSWTASGMYLSLFIYVSFLAWQRERFGTEQQQTRELSVYLTAFILAGAILLFFAIVPASQARYPDFTIHQPAEYFPAILFFLALLGYLGKGDWRRDPFEHWLVFALIIAVMAHAAFMPFSGSPADGWSLAANSLKVLSYGAVLLGLMVSVFVTFRREEHAFGQVKTANEALAQEIRVRRRAEQILQESEDRLQDFLDNANDLIQSVAPDGRILYVNDAWRQTLGYGDMALEKLNLWDILHPRCRERCQQDFQRVQKGETLGDYEVEFIAADGRVVICSGSSNCRFEDGRPVATRSILRNITAQKHAQRDLDGFRANVTALVENTGDTIWSVDRRHCLITFNSAFALVHEARTGREPSKGDLPEALFPKEDAGWYRELYTRALNGERLSQIRTEEVAGQIRHYELFFNPIHEEDGITGVVAFGKDATRRIRAEESVRMAMDEAERANLAKSQFLASMSHELRTPLNSVIGFANLLLKKQEGTIGSKELNFLERILANGHHLLALLNKVLDLAKVEAGHMELDLEEVSLAKLVRETVAELEGQIRDNSVVLRTEVPKEEPSTVEADAGKLKQVLINLVGNSLKFTDKGEVVVRLEMDEAMALPLAIRVVDSGIGIPEDRLQAIFEAFQQAEAGTSRRYGGTGLGLAISHSMCQLMGYDLTVESKLGRGSTFSIVLSELADQIGVRPDARMLAEAFSATEPLPEAEEREGGPIRALVIDDEADSRVLMAHHLRDLGCQVRIASSAENGLELARDHYPDLISLDLMMPELSGWDVLRALRGDPDLQSIPILAVSLTASEQRARVLGSVDVVSKPVDRKEFVGALRRGVGGEKTGRVLIVHGEEDVRTTLGEHAESVGFEVRVATEGMEGLRAVGIERPDIIVLDLIMPGMDGLNFLNGLRKRRDCLGIPVVIMASKEMTPEERQVLELEMDAVLPEADDLESRLRAALASLFPLRKREEVE